MARIAEQNLEVTMSARLALAVVTLALVSPASRLAAQAEPVTLAGRHHITLSAGLTTTAQATTRVGVGGVGVESGASGLLGGIGYAYWLDDRLAAGVRVLAMDATADVTVTGSGTHVESAVVAALLFGVRYQVARLTASNVLRPYATVGVGPLIGSVDNVTAGFPTAVTSVRQAVASGLLAIGADLSLGRHITLGVDAGYLLAADFDQRIGARTNYSAPVVTLSLGVLLGGGRAGR
jgi:hypothetical protein